MADETLRDLERRWQESRDARDGARWLAAVERSGDEGQVLRVRWEVGSNAERARIELAAFLGHEAASWATSQRGSIDTVLQSGWFSGHATLKAELRTRVIVVAARRYLDFFPASERRPADAVAAAEAWLACPCGEHARAARAAHDAAMRATSGELTCEPECCWERDSGAVCVAASAAWAAQDTGDNPTWYWQVTRALEWHEQHADAAIRAADVTEEMRCAAIAWALQRDQTRE